jgi:prevent-host-death family protein
MAKSSAPSVGVNPDVPLTAAREGFTDLVHEVAYGGAMTFLTRHGSRVAALVPVHVAEALLASDMVAAAPGGRRDVATPMSADQTRSFLTWLDALDASLGQAAQEGALPPC